MGLIFFLSLYRGGNRLLEHNALILIVAHEARGPESVSKRFEKEGVLAVFVCGLPQTRE